MALEFSVFGIFHPVVALTMLAMFAVLVVIWVYKWVRSLVPAAGD